MQVHVFGDPRVCQIGPVPVTETMLSSLGVSLVLVAAAVWMRRAVATRPAAPAATAARGVVAWIDESVRQILGVAAPGVATFCGSLLLFIAACNLSGQLPGVSPATGSLATTSALACTVFLAAPTAGLRVRGWRAYLKHYFSPNPLLFPLHVVAEISRTVALAMRLFGNVMSGHLIVGLLVSLVGFLAPMPFMALDLLIGLLQAYIFFVLSTLFLGAAIGAEEKP
jgi:F-type H+-transporting ATPase subunit a